MAKQPNRPANLPDNAVWNGAKNRWELGEKKNGRYIGEYICWYRDGKKKMEANYNDAGVYQGSYKRYHANGEVSQEGHYEKGKLHGWIKYYRGPRNSKEPFPISSYNYNVKRLEIRHIHGKQVSYLHFLESGQEVDAHGRVKPKKVPEGAWWNNREYEWEIGDFTEDANPTGFWRWWRYDGSYVCECTYDENGKLHGYLKRFHNDGTVSREGNYVDGRAEGTHFFHRSPNYTQETFMNSLDAKIVKHEHRYDNNGNVVENKYYDKDGNRVSSKGFPIIDAQVNDLFGGKAEHFLDNYYETFLERMNGQALPAASEEAEKLLGDDFRAFWGIEMPEDLKKVFLLWDRAKFPRLYNQFQPALPKIKELKEWKNAGKNLMEEVVLHAQEWYPYDHLMDWLTGAVCLDQLEQKTGRYSYYHYGFHYGLYAREENAQLGQIFTHEHNGYSPWSTNFNKVIAPNLSAFLMGQSVLSAHNEYDLLTDEEFGNLYDGELSENLSPPYYFITSRQLNGRWLYESDFSFQADTQASCNYFSRGRWILELLRGEASISDCYYSYYRYNKFAPYGKGGDAALEAIRNSVPEAFYHLWSAYWLKSLEAKLPAYLEAAAQSTSLIIQDIAALVKRLYEGEQNQLGILRHVSQLRDKFNGMNG